MAAKKKAKKTARKSLWAKSKAATAKLLPEANRRAAERIESAKQVENPPKKKKTKKNPLMKGKINRTPIKKKKP